VRCSALQCVAVRCSALQCLAVPCSALQYQRLVNQHVLQCVAVCCSALQIVALRWQCVAVHTAPSSRQTRIHLLRSLPHSPLVLPLSVFSFLSRSLAHSHTTLTDKRCLPISIYPPTTHTHTLTVGGGSKVHAPFPLDPPTQTHPLHFPPTPPPLRCCPASVASKNAASSDFLT